MSYKEALLKRLDEIGWSLEKTGKALALLGLGSVGTELDRIDDYSDLDFFAIVKPGFKQSFMDDLGWLERLNPITYRFKNTPDGYKLLYEDGIFCEFAVFEPDEMKGFRLLLDESFGKTRCLIRRFSFRRSQKRIKS